MQIMGDDMDQDIAERHEGGGRMDVVPPIAVAEIEGIPAYRARSPPRTYTSAHFRHRCAEVNGWAKWKDGHWTLELVRNLKAAGKYGKDFAPGHDLNMWVAVFDHTQTRHTVHSRAVRVVTQE
jgi:hypothetical protein